MTPEQQNKLESLKAALKQHIKEAEKATPGPWVIQLPTQHDLPCVMGRAAGEAVFAAANTLNQTSQQNATFIARARTMSPLACKMALVAIEHAEFQIAHGQGGAGLLEDVVSIWEGGEA